MDGCIASAHDDHVLAAIETAIATRAARNTPPGKPLLARHAKMAKRATRRHDHRLGMMNATFAVLQDKLIAAVQPLGTRLDHPDAHLSGLLQQGHGQILPGMAARKGQAIDMVHCRHLAAVEATTLEQSHEPTQPGRVARRGEAGQSTADHSHFAEVLQRSCHEQRLAARNGPVNRDHADHRPGAQGSAGRRLDG